MTNRNVFFFGLFFLLVFLNAHAQKVASGKLVSHGPFQSAYVAARPVNVWLPEGYTPERKYAVLYMHDGQMLFDSTLTWNKQEWQVDEVASHLIASQRTMPFIVVAISNTGLRHSEYFPQKPFEELPKAYRDSLLSSGERPGAPPFFPPPVQSDNYLRFIVNELKPFVDSVYATHSDAANTYIAGSSMGGLISLYAICEYPEVFGGAACLSTHWPGIFEVENNPIPEAFIQYLKAHLPHPDSHRLYFDYGTATLDALYEPFQLKVDEVMRTKGYTDTQWQSQKFEGADHSERAWAARLSIPLIFLLK